MKSVSFVAKSARFAGLLALICAAPVFAEPVDKAEGQEVSELAEALAAFAGFLQSTDQDLKVLEGLVAKIEKLTPAAFDPAADKEDRETQLQYLVLVYSHGCKLDSQTYLPKLRKVASACAADFAGTKLAESALAQQMVFELPQWDSAKFLTELRAYRKAYPQSAFSVQIARMYAFTRQATDVASARKVLEELIPEFADADAESLKQLLTDLALVGKPASFTGPGFAGGTVNLADLRGKVVVLDFWATWCPPCNRMTPKLKKLYDDFKSKGLEIVGVSLDRDEEPLRNYLKDHGITWPQVFTTDRAIIREWAKAFDFSGIPTLYVIDKQGNFQALPSHTFDQVERAVEAALKK